MEKLKATKQERSWIMYDWANSVYATIIMAAIFPIYFAAVAPNGDVWWGYGTSIATFVVAILAPILGAVADYHGMKKKLFTFFLVVGVVFTATMAIFDNWVLLWLGYILSYIGFAGSNLFYDSFLTDVTTHERMDSISARGYAMGYIGGSTIPFLVAIALVFLMPDNNALAIKISVVLTSVWWAVFSIPILRNVHQTHSLGEVPKNLIGQAFKNVWATLKDIVHNKTVFLFIIAYFFYIDGVGTVIHMSTAYGSTLGLGTTGMIIALLVTQIVAAPCAILFSRLAKTVGSARMITVAVIVYIIICIVGFYMGFSLEPSQFGAADQYNETFAAATAALPGDYSELRAAGENIINGTDRTEQFRELISRYKADDPAGAAAYDAIEQAVVPVFDSITQDGSYDGALRRSNMLFWAMAVLVGTCQGGIQALSRSFFGKLIPPEKSNEYFGFFDIFGKFAAVIGPALYAFIRNLTGRPSYGILSLLILFMIALVILIVCRKRFREADANLKAKA